MLADRTLGIVFAVAALAGAALADTARPTIGAIQVLAHLKNYEPHKGAPAEWDPYDNPYAACATRDGNQIVVSVGSQLLWIDGNSGALLRKKPTPFYSSTCRMAMVRRGTESLLAYLGDEWLGEPPSRLSLTIVTRDGTLRGRARWIRDAMYPWIDMEVDGRRVFLNRGVRYDPIGPVLSFDLDTLTESRSYDIPGYLGLYHDSTGIIALTQNDGAFLLPPDGAAIRVVRPGASTTWAECPQSHEPIPVPVHGEFSVTIDHGKPSAACDAQDGINVRDASGRLVARRLMVRDQAWRYMSMVVPWDDGIRVIAQDDKFEGFKLWKVPISF